MTPEHSFSIPPALTIKCLHSKDPRPILVQLHSIEKKSFPANEALEFNVKLLGKQNTSTLYASLRDDEEHLPVAYAVYVRWRSIVLLQKLCVAGTFRGRRIGKVMMLEILARARQTGCSAVELWVDPSRTAARGLYFSCGFQDVQYVHDYYAHGRDGIKMKLYLHAQSGPT
jgi:ribosomal protein S18 acetylase RimI-like enzyme